jgi:hypothetical protein
MANIEYMYLLGLVVPTTEGRRLGSRMVKYSGRYYDRYPGMSYSKYFGKHSGRYSDR